MNKQTILLMMILTLFFQARTTKYNHPNSSDGQASYRIAENEKGDWRTVARVGFSTEEYYCYLKLQEVDDIELEEVFNQMLTEQDAEFEAEQVEVDAAVLLSEQGADGIEYLVALEEELCEICEDKRRFKPRRRGFSRVMKQQKQRWLRMQKKDDREREEHQRLMEVDQAYEDEIRAILRNGTLQELAAFQKISV